jgi:hypothetical protein
VKIIDTVKIHIYIKKGMKISENSFSTVKEMTNPLTERNEVNERKFERKGEERPKLKGKTNV